MEKPIRYNKRLDAGVYRSIKPYTNGKYRYKFVMQGVVKGWYDKRKDAEKRYFDYVRFHTYKVNK